MLCSVDLSSCRCMAWIDHTLAIPDTLCSLTHMYMKDLRLNSALYTVSAKRHKIELFYTTILHHARESCLGRST